MMWNNYVGVVVHTVILLAVYDIYFRSEVIQGHNPPFEGNKLTQRVVLIVVDKMNAEPLFKELTQERNELCLSETLKNSSWGILKTRTHYSLKSGIVAMTAGIQENPLIYIIMNCKYKPKIDNVFDKVDSVHYFGSSVVTKFFETIDSKKNWKSQITPNGQTKSESNEYVVQEVLEHFKKYIPDQDDVQIILIQLQNENQCMDLHNYRALQKIDEYVSTLVSTISDYYNDNETTYIFTSSQGFEKWEQGEIKNAKNWEIPIIAWGKGINQCQQKAINQEDICPLIANLLGVNIPSSSKGFLPKDYLSISDDDLILLLSHNVIQLASISNTTEGRLGSGPLFNMGIIKPRIDPKEHIKIEEMAFEAIYIENHTSTIKTLKKYGRLMQKNIDYYHKIFTTLIYSLTVITNVGWCCWLLTYLVNQKTEKHLQNSIKSVRYEIFIIIKLCINFPFLVLAGLQLWIVIAQRWPIYYLIYSLLPTLLWCGVCNRIHVWYVYFKNMNLIQAKTTAICIVITNVAAEVIVLCLKLHFPLIFGMCMMTAVYPVIHLKNRRNFTILGWILSSIILCLIILYPYPSGIEFHEWIIVSGVAWSIVGTLIIITLIPTWCDFIIALNMLILNWSITTVKYILHNDDLTSNLVVWIPVILIPVIATFSTSNPRNRQLILCLAVGNSLHIIASGTEPIIFLLLCLILHSWMLNEANPKSETSNSINEMLQKWLSAPIFVLLYIMLSQACMSRFDEMEPLQNFASQISIKQNSIGYAIGIRFVLLLLTGLSTVMCAFRLKGLPESSILAKVLLILNLISLQLIIELPIDPGKRDATEELSSVCFIQMIILTQLIMYPISIFFASVPCKIIISCKENLERTYKHKTSASVEQITPGI